MKSSLTLILTSFFVLTVLHASFADEYPFNHDSVYLNEIRFGSGYYSADLKNENSDDDLEMGSAFLSFGFNINSLLGLENHKGTLQYVIEPFIKPILSPTDNIAAGAHLLMFKYSYPFTDQLTSYIEIGSGPMYLGVDTFEQGNAGFNFHDIGGVGFQFFFQGNKSFNVGYRKVHISNLDTRDPNGGIDGDEITLGFSLHY